MRALLLAFVLIALAVVPTGVAGGSVGCNAIPHTGPVIGAIGSCAVSYTSGAGTKTFVVEVAGGTIGTIEIEALGPNNGIVQIDCVVTLTAPSCIAVFNSPLAGPWTATARANHAFASDDAWTRLTVNYP